MSEPAADSGPAAELRVFAYGTLLAPEIMQQVIGRRPAGRPAVLEGYAAFLMRGECFPGLVAATQCQMRGLVFDRISSGELRWLDEYEGEMYSRESVRVALDSGGWAETLVYVLRPEARDQLTEVPWDFEHFAAEEAVRFLDTLR